MRVFGASFFPFMIEAATRKSSMRPPVQVPKIASSIRTLVKVGRTANVREIVGNRDQGLDLGNVEVDDAAAIRIRIGGFRRPFAIGRTMCDPARVVSSGWMYPVFAPKSITMLQRTSRSAIGIFATSGPANSTPR